MRALIGFAFVIVFGFTSTIIMMGCSTRQMGTLPDSIEHSCVQGKVFYKVPTDSAAVPYPSVTVTAWQHEENKPLTETKTDQAGNYCIEVPLGDFRVDLRVWGMVHSPKTSYTCTGSEDNIDIGTALNRCGKNCKKIDITVDCKEWTRRRRP